MANQILSNNLKRCRKSCGFTQQQVADVLKINRTTYTYYETGKTEPSIDTLVKLCKLFAVNYDVLLPQLSDVQLSF